MKDKQNRGLLQPEGSPQQSPGRPRISLDKDSMVQDILRLDYQSVPNNESIHSNKDPFEQANF